MRPPLPRLLAIVLALTGCSAPYNIRLSDDRSASCGPLFFFGWADPPLIPGTRLVDAPPGSRVVLWNEAGLEAIVDLGETCPVLVRDDDAARAPTDVELSVIAAVFPGWPLAPSSRPGEYAAERRLERRFPSHIQAHFEKLGPRDMVKFAFGDAPAGWLAQGGRAHALAHAAGKAPAEALAQILDLALEMGAENRRPVLSALLKRPELLPPDLVRIARAGAPELAAVHRAADESVCLVAVDEVAKEPLSSSRRRGLEAILASPGVTARIRQKVLEVPLAYPEDREAIRAKAGR